MSDISELKAAFKSVLGDLPDGYAEAKKNMPKLQLQKEPFRTNTDKEAYTLDVKSIYAKETTKEDISKESIPHIIQGLLTPQHHTVLWGASGAYKSTWALSELIRACCDNENMIVHYWGFDLSTPSIKAALNIAEECGIKDRFHIFSNKVTYEDYDSYYKSMIKQKVDLTNYVIANDTFKFISKDINNKNSNKDALHFIKALQGLGASVLSLGHANKDGANNSGTAELEQDSDALIKISATIAGDIVLINFSKNGKRVRWGMDKDVTYSCSHKPATGDNAHLYWENCIRTMQLSEDLDFEAVNSEITDETDIEIVKGIIFNNPIGVSDLYKKINDKGIPQRRVKPLLEKYEGKHWKLQFQKTDNKRMYVLV